MNTNFVNCNVGTDDSVLNLVLHYLSTLSGPFLACVCGGILTLIPIHNVMEEPEYWYEDSIIRNLSMVTVYACLNTIRAEYWCNFVLENKFKTYLLMIGFMHVVGAIFNIVHYYFWTDIFGQFLPMALAHYVGGSAGTCIISVILLQR